MCIPPARPAVDVTYKLLIHHGGWRAHVLSKGYIAEEDVAQPLAANTIFLQVRSAALRCIASCCLRISFCRRWPSLSTQLGSSGWSAGAMRRLL